MPVRPHRFRLPAPRAFALGMLLCAVAGQAGAYTVTLGNGPRTAFLRVGDGGAGTYTGGGLGSSNTVDTVSVNVSDTAMIAGTPMVMTPDSTQRASSYDGYTFCDPGEVYIGGYVRGSASGATLTASVPAGLTNTSGQTIPMSQISWTSAGRGDTGAQPIPGGTFSPGTQTLATFARNTWNESCHTFTYANSAIQSAGTYTARVTYTLSAP